MSAAAPDRTLYDEGAQSLAREQLDVLTARSSTDLIARVRSAPTLYSDTNVRRLSDLPLLSGRALAAEIEAHPPFGRLQAKREALIRAGLTTAAVPRPVPIAWSRADLDREAALGARCLWRAGLRPRTHTSDCLDGGLVTPGTLAITDALDVLDALALPVGPITSDAALARAREVWEIVRPAVVIVDFPSFEFLERSQVLPGDVSIVLLLTPERRDELAAPVCPNVFRILSIPQLGTFAAGECAAHTGYHVAEDDLAVEIVDPDTGAPLPDGTPGAVLLSTLARSFALLRFDTGLRCALDRGPCGCGETHARLRFA